MDQGHGRHETHQVYPFAVSPEQTGFPYAAQAAIVVRTTHHLKSLCVTEEMEIMFSSRPAQRMNSAQFQRGRRRHWGIENHPHYVRDVSFAEDRSTVRTGHAPQNLATLCNLVIGLCALDAARQNKRSSYLPTFRGKAQNHRQIAIDLLTQPLLAAT